MGRKSGSQGSSTSTIIGGGSGKHQSSHDNGINSMSPSATRQLLRGISPATSTSSICGSDGSGSGSAMMQQKYMDYML